MTILIVKTPIKKAEVIELANEEFGDLVKAVVDVEQEIMALAGELHADEEVMLGEQAGSKREYTWGINIYPKKDEAEWIEFDSMINLKPAFGNRSRSVDSPEIQEKIRRIVKRLITD